jgi:class 3 adenylate cyclase
MRTDDLRQNSPKDREPSGRSHAERVPRLDEIDYDPIHLRATCMFADIHNWSRLTNELGDRSATEIISAFFSKIVPAIEEEGGMVGDFNGDGALIIFSGKGRSRRAVLAAIKVMRIAGSVIAPRVHELFERSTHEPRVSSHEMPFSVRIGVDVSELYAVRVGTRENSGVSWVGRSPNACAKLTRQSDPGSITITREVSSELARGTGIHGADWSSEAEVRIGGDSRFVRTVILT